MNVKSVRMIEEVERRGGEVWICETTPAITEQIFEEVLTCPCCITEPNETPGPGIDDILGGRIPKRFSGQ